MIHPQTHDNTLFPFLSSLPRREHRRQKRHRRDLIVVDLFCGAGGTSCGVRRATGRSPFLAGNHNEHAIRIHKRNHPETIHYEQKIADINPRLACRGKHIDLLCLSPDCTHFSNARGSAPKDNGIRHLADEALHWARDVGPDCIILENVREFLTWGPLYPNDYEVEKLQGQPIPERAGEDWDRWCRSLRAMGYTVEWKLLNAADFGAPTRRIRLFVIARCDGQAIRWPEPTHGPGRPLPWRTAAECIDWSIPSLSIFATKQEAKDWARAMRGLGHKISAPRRPLAEATERRVAMGIFKYVLNAADPFVVRICQQGSDSGRVRSVNEPLSTVCTKNEHVLVTPHLTAYHGRSVGSEATGPMPTGLGHAHDGLVLPHLTKFYGTSTAASLGEPMPASTAQAGGGHLGVVAPIIGRAHGKGWDRDASGVLPAAELMPTLTTSEEWALMTPHLVNTRNGEHKGQAPRTFDVQAPYPTITAQGSQHALASAFLAKHYGGGPNGQPTPGTDLRQPMDTVTARDHHALAQLQLGYGDRQGDVFAFLMKYHGRGGQWSKLNHPMHVIDTTARMGLVTVEIGGTRWEIRDICLRMLRSWELSKAMDFDEDYIFEGSEADCIERIGNAVSPAVACALIVANFDDEPVGLAA